MSKTARFYFYIHPKTTADKSRSVDRHMNAEESSRDANKGGFLIIKNLCTKASSNLTQKRGLEDHWPETGSAIEAHWGGCRENTFFRAWVRI
jgi:hypothetical protein